MFLIREVNEKKATPYYYHGMIAGLIIEVDESEFRAKKFETREEAEAEIEEFSIFLKGFEIQETA